MNALREWHARGVWVLVGWLAAMGAVAGLLSWCLMWPVHALLDIGRPDVLSLVLAVPRGALFGAVLGLLLSAWWRKGRA